MVTKEGNRIYAKTFSDYIVAHQDRDKLINDINKLLKLFLNSNELVRFFSSPIYKIDMKKSLYLEIAGNYNFSSNLNNFINLLIDKNKATFIIDILSRVIRIVDDTMGIARPQIYTISEPSNEIKDRIINFLKADLNKEIKPEFNIDKEILGGVLIRMKEKIYDSSLKNHLNKIKNELIRAQ